MAGGCISLRMQDRQKPIADWLADVMERRGISARAWAEKAKLGKDTVSRAIRPDYEHVTSTTTIAKLAEALGEQPYGAAGGVPSEASLASILEVLHQAILGDRPISSEVTAVLAASLRDTLLHIADEPEAMDDPKLSRGIARGLTRRREAASSRLQKS